MTESTTTAFRIGDKVRNRRNRTRLGEIVGGPDRIAGRTLFQVRWDDRSLERLPEARLVAASEGGSVTDLLREGAFEGREAFVRNYTHRKLRTPVDDTLYSLNTSRTQILPHQFKPLLRFLDSLHRRYLIADEVGLGKTIEAGIILSELRARRALGGVLVVSPNHLREKWRAELQHRFDESFDIVTRRADFLDLLERIEADGSENRRVIVGHKTIAARAIVERLEEGAPAFDLLIIDEAHYLRNPATLVRRAVAEIADASNQLLLLTATPIQTDAENLLSLLRLIDQASFRSLHLFNGRLEANRYLVSAEKALRRAQDDPGALLAAAVAADQALEGISTQDVLTFGLNDDGGLDRIRSGLRDLQDAPDLASAADLAGAIRERNLLTPYITRTRKAEVESTAVRRVERIHPFPDLLPEERAFYDSVVSWCRETIARRHGEGRVLFLSREIERRLASSLPAFAHGLLRGVHDRDGVLGDPPSPVLDLARAVPKVGTKARWLLTLLERLNARDPTEKAIVFASFRPTLRHLSRILQSKGIDFELIHGGVTMDPVNRERDDRGNAVRRFLSDPGCRVLLSSNVGGEGLDLQRASVVVNFDMPWNPAVVEQRIGRVDRFGQERETVQVLNFLLPGTVEEVVFDRLASRLKLFESTLGDFGRVLGKAVDALTESFLKGSLTLEEAQERAGNEAWQLLNRQQHMDALLRSEGDLIAFDEDFTDRLREMDREGLTIRPEDVRAVCEGVLRAQFPKSWIRPVSPAADSESVYDLRVDFDLHHHLQRRLFADASNALRRFLQRFPPDTVRRVTFAGETAERDPELILLTPRHPFVRALVEATESGDGFHPVSALELPERYSDGRGRGLLVVSQGSVTFGPQERRHLIPVFVPSGHPEAPVVGRRLVRDLLDHGRDVKPQHLPDGPELASMVSSGETFADGVLLQAAQRIAGREEARIRPRLAELRERFRRRLERNQERIHDEVLKQPPDQKRVLGLAKYRKDLERELARKEGEIERMPEPEMKLEVVGVVWVEGA